ncbi:MAG: XdhC family protein [Acidobacteriota bacterium]|nr:XdhC family protein [Acidobacteriota bacterium]
MTDLSAFFERVAALKRHGQPFAVATVVSRRAPVSAHLGDRAIVFADGRMEGFVGGACSREIIRKQALDVLRSRAGRLVSIRPDASEAAGDGADRVVVPMTCASEGAVDVYVEPVVRPRSIVVAGATPVADAVTRLARAMRYDVVRVVDGDERRDVETEASVVGATVAALDSLETVLRDASANGADCAVVVASQGHYDEPALETTLKSGVSYVGLVASRKRGATIRGWLVDSHVPNLDRLRSPAGLDLGGRTADEVALSILGEIVQAGAASTINGPAPHAASLLPGSAPSTRPATLPAPESPTHAVAVDPVCHMDVDIASAKHTVDLDETTYYFCCPGCRARFVKDPQRYLAPTT